MEGKADSMGALSAAEVSYIEGGIEQNLRSDGRGRQDFRNISIVTGVIPQVNHTQLGICSAGLGFRELCLEFLVAGQYAEFVIHSMSHDQTSTLMLRGIPTSSILDWSRSSDFFSFL